MPRERIDLPTHELRGTKPQYVCEDSHVTSGRPRYPKNISPDAKRVFKHISRLLERRRTLTEADGELVRLLALAYDRHAKAMEKLAEQGEVRVYTRLDRKGEQTQVEAVNLWLKVAQESEKFMVSCYDRLGLTPLNRAKVRQTEPKSKPPEPTFPSREEAAPAPEPEIDLSKIDEGVVN